MTTKPWSLVQSIVYSFADCTISSYPGTSDFKFNIILHMISSLQLQGPTSCHALYDKSSIKWREHWQDKSTIIFTLTFSNQTPDYIDLTGVSIGHADTRVSIVSPALIQVH